MEKPTKMGFSKNKPLTRNPLPGDKHTGLDPAILFYEVEHNDKFDSGDESLIRVKIVKALPAIKKNTKKMTFQEIKYFYHQGPKIIRVLRQITLSVIEQLGSTNWKGTDQLWGFFEQVLKGPDLTKYRNSVLAYKELVRKESGNQWSVAKPEDVASDNFWVLCKTDGLGSGGYEITAEVRCIDLDRDLWFILVRSQQCVQGTKILFHS